MELRQLHSFVVLAEVLHFGRAAERMHLTTSALSQQVRRLERETGCQLFERTSRSVVLTEDGTKLLVDAPQLLAAERRLLATASERRARTRGRSLRVALFAHALDALTRPVHDAFERAHPGVRQQVRGHLSYDDHLQAVARREVDVFAVRPPYEPVPDVALIPVFTEPAVAVVRADDPRADAHELDPEDLLDDLFPTVPHAPVAWSSYWALDRYRNGEARRSTGTPVLVHGEDLTFIEHGEGITTTALSRVRRDLYDPLVAVPVVGARSVLALAVHADHDETVADYVSTVQHVAQDLLSLVPGAELLPP